jgi:hypothetical protein
MLLPARLSRYIGSIRSLKRMWRSHVESRLNDRNVHSLACRMTDVFQRTWDLGFTAFGGPPVHFQILYGRFVEGKGGKEKWVDEQTVQHQLYQLHRRRFWKNFVLTCRHSIRNSSLSARAFLVQAVRRCYSVSLYSMRDLFRLSWHFSSGG